MKQCSVCGKEKPLSKFNRKGKGYQYCCKNCQNTYSKKHYKENKEKYFQKNKKRIIELYKFVNLLKLKCNRCSEDDPLCLDFHHIGGEKEINISEAICRGWSKKRIKKKK